jgi:hypothetical protein
VVINKKMYYSLRGEFLADKLEALSSSVKRKVF